MNEPIEESENEGTNTNQENTYPIQNNDQPNVIGNEEDEYTYESALLRPGEELKEEVDDGMGMRRVWDEKT